MKFSPLIVIGLLLLSQHSIAEVFKCVQNDGSTVYAHVPCTAKPDPNLILGSALENKLNQSAAMQMNQPIRHRQITEIEKKIAILQEQISDLQNAQDDELYAVETNVVKQTELYDMQRSIRNRYTIVLNKNLMEMATLRREKDFLALSPEHSITNAQ